MNFNDWILRSFGGPAGGAFLQRYRCYSAAFSGKPQIENGGKIILPPSALDQLTQLHIDYPMLFELSNPTLGRKTHCGVLEFVADEGVCYLPYWMMQHLLIEEGGFISVKSATLPKGKFVKLQPHTSNFLDISNPKAVLELSLRNFAALTQGDVICIKYNEKNYYLNVLEVQPALPTGAITIVEADVIVDFAPPLDYKEPTPQPTTAQVQLPTQPTIQKQSQPQAAPAQTAPPPETKPAFAGEGFRLDGKKPTTAPVSVPSTRPPAATTAASPKASSPASTPPTSLSGSGKLVFGAKTEAPPKPKIKEPPKEPPKDAKTFVAFSGQGNRLK